MKMISFFFKYSPRIMMLSVAAGLISGACNTALLALINAKMKTDSVAALLWGFAGLCFLFPVTRFISEFMMNRLGQGAMYNLRMQLCRQILAAPLLHLEQLGAPRLLATLTDDVTAITTAILMFPLICVNTAVTVGCLIYMGILSPLLLMIVLGFLVIGIAGYQIPIVKVHKIFALARKDSDALQGHFRALTQGTKELKGHSGRRRAFISEGLEKTAESFRRHNLFGQNLYSAAASWGQALVFVVVGLILFLLPVIRPLTTTMMFAYALTLLYLMTPLQVVMNSLPPLARANVSLKKIEELGFTLSSQGTEEVVETDFSPAPWKTLELKSMTHAYRREGETEVFVLGPIDLSFQSGELVFLIGGNGSGKTTLVKLLTGLYAPEQGQIVLDGVAIGNNNKEFYRQHFSTVFSDFFLFDQMLGLVGAQRDERAREYLAQLKLSHKVQIVDGKLSTTDLSQGQRKRLALLTAYLEDRPIYVFDEWAADQDPYFKSVFYTQLLPELKAKGKTVFVISHDDRYYHIADRLIKLEDGKVVSDAPNLPEPATLASTVGRSHI